MNGLQRKLTLLFSNYEMLEDELGNLTVTGRIRFSPLETLPLDVIERILKYIPDFSSLCSAILSTPRIHETFVSYRKGILKTVLSTDTSPYARSIYRASIDHTSRASDECMIQPLKLCTQPMTVHEEFMLSHYKQTAERWETYCTTLFVAQIYIGLHMFLTDGGLQMEESTCDSQ
jgi:hypothetical protein